MPPPVGFPPASAATTAPVVVVEPHVTAELRATGGGEALGSLVDDLGQRIGIASIEVRVMDTLPALSEPMTRFYGGLRVHGGAGTDHTPRLDVEHQQVGAGLSVGAVWDVPSGHDAHFRGSLGFELDYRHLWTQAFAHHEADSMSGGLSANLGLAVGSFSVFADLGLGLGLTFTERGAGGWAPFLGYARLGLGLGWTF